MPHTLTNNRHVVGWLSLAQLVTWGSVFYTFALLVAPLEAELGMTRSQSSLAFSLALLTEGFLAYPVGRLIERGHERWVMTGGSLAVALCMVVHSQIHSVTGFYAVWIGLGAAMSATLYAPAFAVLTRRFPQDFRRAIITLTFLGGLATTVFTPLSAWLIDAWGWRVALLCLASLQLGICAPIHLLMLRQRHVPEHLRAATHSPAPLGPYLRSPSFLLLGVFGVVMMGVTAAMPAHLVSLLREAGLSPAWVIAIPASMGLIQVAGRLLLFFFERRFDVHTANRLIPCLLPLGMLVLVLGYGHVQAALWFVALFGLGNGMLTIVKGTAMAQYVSREHTASLNGALGIPQALARAAAPLALGLLWSPQEGYRMGLWLLLGLGLVGVIALVLAQRYAKNPEVAIA